MPRAATTPDVFRRVVAAGGLLSLGLGIGVIAIGPCLPGLREEFALSDTASGALVALQGGTFGLAVVAAGRLGDRRGRTRPLVAGVLVQIVGLTLLGLAPAAWAAFVAVVAIGIGSGLSNAGISALVAEHEERRRDRALLLTGAGFGVGALFAPGMSALLFAVGLGWRWPLLAGAAICAAVLPAIRLFPPEHAPSVRAAAATERVRALLRDRRVRTVIVMTAAYYPVEGALAAWFPVFTTEERGFSDALAAATVACFWGALTVARLYLGTRRRQPDPARMIPLLMGASLLLYVLMLLVPGRPVAIVVMVISGALLGGVFPLSMGAGALHAPLALGTVMGLMLGIGGAMSLVVPLAMGAASDAADDPTAGIAVATAMLALSLGAALFYGAARRSPV